MQRSIPHRLHREPCTFIDITTPHHTSRWTVARIDFLLGQFRELYLLYIVCVCDLSLCNSEIVIVTKKKIIIALFNKNSCVCCKRIISMSAVKESPPLFLFLLLLLSPRNGLLYYLLSIALLLLPFDTAQRHARLAVDPTAH